MAVTIEEALEIIYKQSKAPSIKLLPIEQSIGYILAQDIVAKHNLPPFANSAMDGYAVKVADSNKKVPVIDTVLAGDNSNTTLKIGNAIKIMTGAKIPEGCECIVPKEDVIESDNTVQLPKELMYAKHIRELGEDILIGDKLLSSGDKLNAYQITLLASQGISHVQVCKKPKVSIFGSGSELKMHFQTVQSHQLYNTNTPTLAARALELGCEVDVIGTAADSLQSLQEHIKSALDSDLIITSGGISVGDSDFTQEAFSSFNSEVFFNKVAIKPGKPTTLSKIGDTLILNLPGNPLACSMNFELFGQSIILALSGITAKYINTVQAKIKDDYRVKGGRRTLIPGFFDGIYFTPCKKFAPGMVSPLSESNAYIMLHEDCTILHAHSNVKVITIPLCLTTHQQVNLVSAV